MEVYAARADDAGKVAEVTLVGNDNAIEGDATRTFLAGTDGLAAHSDEATATGHAVRLLSSDTSSGVGADVNVTDSDGAVALGHDHRHHQR